MAKQAWRWMYAKGADARSNPIWTGLVVTAGTGCGVKSAARTSRKVNEGMVTSS
jgi:hypothetical protein